RHDTFKTLLHSAALSGEPSILQYLNPTADELLDHDQFGYTSLHYAASKASLELIKLILTRVLHEQQAVFISSNRPRLSSDHSTLEPVTTRSSMEESKSSSIFRNFMSRDSNSDDEAIEDNALRGKMILREGMLRKKKEGNRWQKRYCVLTT